MNELAYEQFYHHVRFAVDYRICRANLDIFLQSLAILPNVNVL